MSTSPLPPDPYEALGVDRDADLDTIKKAHRKLALKHHPDRVKDPSLVEQSKFTFQRVQQAYELLVDPIRRQRYNDQHRLQELLGERMISTENYFGRTGNETKPVAPVSRPSWIHEERAPDTPYISNSDRFVEPARKVRREGAANARADRIRKPAKVEAEVKQDAEGQSNWWDRLATNSPAKSHQVKTDERERKTEGGGRPRATGWDRPTNSAMTMKMAFDLKAKADKAKEKAKEKQQARDREIRVEQHSRYRRAVVTDSESSSSDTDGRLPPPRRPSPQYQRRTSSPRPERRRQVSPRPARRSSHGSASETEKWERHYRNSQAYLQEAQNRAQTNGRGRVPRQDSQTRRQRSSSVRSNASSANRSLGDGRQSSFNADYQSPDFGRRRGGSASSYEIPRESPSLPPAPFKRHSSSVLADTNRPFQGSKLRPTSNLTQTTSITTRNCYLCNKDIQITRKRDWQCHLLDDLQPYQCIEETCRSTETFKRLKLLRAHYEQNHRDAPIMMLSRYVCLFCEEELPRAKIPRFKHVGAHLRDHAFSIIPRPQTGRQLYSDSSSNDELRRVASPRTNEANDLLLGRIPPGPTFAKRKVTEPERRTSDINQDNQRPSRIVRKSSPLREREWDRDRDRDRRRPPDRRPARPTYPTRQESAPLFAEVTTTATNSYPNRNYRPERAPSGQQRNSNSRRPSV